MEFSLSQEAELKGIITRSFSIRNGYLSRLNCGEYSLDLVGNELLEAGKAVMASGIIEEHAGKMQLRAGKVVILEGEEAAIVMKEVEKKAEKKSKIGVFSPLVDDSLVKSLAPVIENAARKILSAKALERFVLLRFHGDADGISGAIALTKMCKMQAIQQNSAIYSVGEAMRDLQTLHHEFMPILILLDFGSNSESEEGLKLLKAAGIEIIVIDHHPPGKGVGGIANVFLSPWAISKNWNDEDVSKYPAGYLAIEVARVGGISGIDDFAKTSCAGDKSRILPIDEKDKEKALVLDYMASYSGFGNNLEFYAGVMGKHELFHSMLLQAKEKIEQIFETVKRSLKEKEVNGVKIAVIDLEKISKKHEFPSKGKIATRIFESINSEKPLVVLGYSEKSVIFRINEPAVERGISADKIIAELKVTMADFVESGGGHAKAAAVRIREEFARDAIEEIVKVIERIASS
jgi:RecJ-like exonuclease